MKHHKAHWVLLFLLALPLVVLVAYTSNETKQSVTSRAQTAQPQKPTTTVVASNLEVPWAIAFLPDGNMLVTERPGRIKMISKTGQVTEVGTIAEVKAEGEGGLLGIAVHPQYASNSFIYVYYTYGNSGNNTLNRVARYNFSNNKLSAPLTIVDAIPGASNHNGGRLKFGPDNFLYITTGDAANPTLAQDKTSLAGKILRVTDAGQPAPGNPFSNRTYSYGHRNPQGLAWNGSTMYATEHGNSFKDELNKIEAGKNYGWPTIEGDAKSAGLETPLANSGSNSWAPSGAAFFNGTVYFAGLKGTALFESSIQGTTASVKELFKGELGRIREVVVGPDNMLYITTSNRDGRGTPKADDDKILKVQLTATAVSPGAASPSGTSVSPSPSFYPLAPCPTCDTPSDAPVSGTPSESPEPSSSVIVPSSSPDPCEAGQASLAHNKGKKGHGSDEKGSKHNRHDGGVSNFAEAILRFLIELLNLLLKLLGGGQINLPNPTDPCNPSNGNPLTPDNGTMPGISGAPGDPNNPNAPGTGDPNANPSFTPVNRMNPVPSGRSDQPLFRRTTNMDNNGGRPIISQPLIDRDTNSNPNQPLDNTFDENPNSSPNTQPNPNLTCIPSGQKCDATGARKCCKACTQNINPNATDDPGTCD